MVVLRWLIAVDSEARTAGRQVKRRVRGVRTKRSSVGLVIECLEERKLMAFDPTAIQQELLESVNRMRLNPQGELSVLFSSINPLVARDADAQRAIVYYRDQTSASIQTDWASLRPTSPLAWSEALTASATQYSVTMMNADRQDHGIGGTTGSRAVAAGYSSTYVSENIAAHSYSAFNAHSAFAIDWGNANTNRGHRLNIMDINPQTLQPMGMREIGIGAVANTRASVNSSLVQPLIVTQNFGKRSDQGNSFLLGVACTDRNGDGRYNAGEGLGGLTIVVRGSAGTFTTNTMTAGGYQLQVPAGSYQITVSGSGYSGPSSATVQVGAANVKRDFLAPPVNPGSPLNLIGVSGNGQAVLTWAAPTSDGGGNISGYLVQYSSNGGATWAAFPRPASASTTATVTGLTNGTAYVFRVAAVNSAGTGAYSPVSAAITPATVASAPGGLTPTVASGQLSLIWTAPSSNGGAAITNYVIQFSSNGGAAWSKFAKPASTALAATVTGLTNGTSYVFRVAAVNRAGRGAFSAVSAAATPMSAPMQPTIASAVAGNAQATLTWVAPASNGGSPITNYVIQYSADAGRTWTPFARPVSTATTATVTGLVGGTSYVFRMAAVNAVGTSVFSAASAAVVPRTTAGTPGSLVAVPTDSQVALTWAAPASNGGAIVTDYTIQYSSNGGSTWTTVAKPASAATSATVTGLVNGTSYLFRVAAVNSVGTGAFAATNVSSTPRTVPSAPSLSSLTAGNGQVTVAWSAPQSNGGAPITEYNIQYSGDAGTTWITNSVLLLKPTRVIGLVNETRYIFRIAAVNSVGTSSFSGSLEITPFAPQTVPSTPSNVRAFAGRSQATLTWTPPASTGGSPITGFVIQYSSNNGTTWFTSVVRPSGTAKAAIVTGLLGGRAIFKVAAVNAIGIGQYSIQSVAVTIL